MGKHVVFSSDFQALLKSRLSQHMSKESKPAKVEDIWQSIQAENFILQ